MATDELAAAAAEIDEILASPPRSRRLPLLIAAVVLLAGLGAGAWFLVPKFFGAKHAGHDGAPARKEAVELKAGVPVGPVVVNLAGGARQYARIAVQLGVPGPKDVKVVEEAKARVLDLLIAVVAARTAEALASTEGRDALKRDLLAGIQGDVGLPRVGRVYFTEFVIQ